MKSLYKRPEAKETLMRYHEEKMQSLRIEYTESEVETRFGKTHITKAGDESLEPIVFFHGVHAGASLTLEAIQELSESYQLIVIDTVGQATKSAETRINLKDDSFAQWADEVFEQLGIESANCIGISYGAFILQKLLRYFPNRVKKCIFIVPSGIVNGPIWPSIRKLSIPLMRFQRHRKEEDLKRFISAFGDPADEFTLKFQRLLLLDVHMDYRRPPLLKKRDLAHVDHPIYLMVASNDIFFPGDQILKRSQKIFKNIKGQFRLENSKHIPNPESYSIIQGKIVEWIEA